MDGRAHAEQDRADGLGIAEAIQQFVSNVGRFQRGEDQHIGILDRAERIAFLHDLGFHRGIGLHLTIHHQVGAAGFRQRDGLLDFFGERVWRGAKIGEREEGHARLDLQLLGIIRGQASDLGQVFRRRVNVDRGVGEQVNAVVHDHDIHARGARGAFRGVVDPERGADHIGIIVGQAGDEGIRIAHLHHHRAEDVDLAHAAAGDGQRHTFAAAQGLIGLRVLFVFRKIGRVEHIGTTRQAQFFDALLDHFRAANQDGRGDALFLDLISGANDFGLFALGERDALHPAAGARLVLEEVAHLLALALAVGQLLAIFVNVNLLARHAGLHGRLGHRGRFPQQHARIQRLGDDVLAPEFHAVHAVGPQDRIRHIFLGQRGQGLGSGKLHIIVDGPSAHVQRAAEDEREPQHIVHLVRVIRTSGGNDHILAGRLRQFIFDFGVGIRHGKQKWILGHGLDHLRRHHIRHRQAIKYIGAAYGIRQGAGVGIHRKTFLIFVHALCAAFIDYAPAVAQHNVLALHAPADGQFRARDGRRARPVDDHAHILVLLSYQFQRIGQRGR